MRILITGSREWSDTLTIVGALLSAVPSEADLRDVTVVHGGCPTGADFFAARAAGELGFLVEEHPADWAEHGKAAGPVRNQGMVDAGADVCLAFFQPGAANRGTQDCVIRAMRAGIPIKRYPEGGVSVPAGDSPDSPPAGESRLPGGSDDYLALEPTGNATYPWVSLSPPVPDYPVVVLGPGGRAHVEPISEYYGKREAGISS